LSDRIEEDEDEIDQVAEPEQRPVDVEGVIHVAIDEP
jgi:hypothetical protein